MVDVESGICKREGFPLFTGRTRRYFRIFRVGQGNLIQELTHGVTVTNEWMKEMINGDVGKKHLGKSTAKW